MKKLCFALFSAMITITAYAQAPAFPGAEGFGRYVTGGRGGKVVHVTNLNDSGTGSLRAAVSGGAAKIVVFDVSGIIELQSDLGIGANTTILGQTAPEPGITLRYYSVRPNGSNIIMRYIRVRRGEERDVNDGADACWAKNFTGMILDHCSFSWSIDEVASFYDNCDYTMQWCTIGEALANPGHTKGEHSYGGIWGGKGASFHHNMICHVQNRAPRLNGARYGWQGYNKTKYPGGTIMAEQVDLRNNVMYNWGRGNGAYGGMGGYHIIVNNYYKAGPATANKTRVFQCGHTTGKNTDGGSAIDPNKKGIYGHFYISGNYVTAAGTSAENYDWKGVIVDDVSGIPDSIKLSSPISCFVNSDVTTHTAQNAYLKVLDYAGASLFRDNVDKRYVREAKNGTTTYTGSATAQGDGSSITHWPGIIDFVKDQGTYSLVSKSRALGFDADSDGMADAWEQANGGNLEPGGYDLDPRGWYTNIEVYANSLVEDIVKAGNADAASSVDEYYPTCVYVDVNASSSGGGGETSVEGSVTWPFNTGGAGSATVANAITAGIASTSVTLGSDLSYNGIKGVNGLTVTQIQQNNVNATAASANNAITFSLTTNEGYKFLATDVSFTACRMGTDKGKIDVWWKDGECNNELESELVPDRNNNQNGNNYYSTCNYSLEGDAAATEGTSSLVLYLYDLSFNKDGVDNFKSYGFCNVVINGKVISTTTGIENPVTLSFPATTEYYTVSGQRIGNNPRGIVIEKTVTADGKTVTHKVIR